MQNFKKIMSKNLCSAVIFFTYLFIMPSVWMAEGADVPPQIFVGDTPTAISVQRGEPVEVPIFFVGGTCIDKEVELYVFRLEEQGLALCFGPDGWESDYAELEDFKPFCNVPGLPEHIYLRWQAFEDSQSLSNFDLWVCVDDHVDGILTENSVYCGHQSIIIEEGDSGTGTGDDNGTGTGDDPGSGGDDDSGSGDDSGGFQLPTPPPFPGFGDDGSCNSLKFTPEGTAFSHSSISSSLELGAASEQIILYTTACGKSVTVGRVTKTSGGAWLSASSGGGSKVILDLDAGASDVQAGSTYTGTVKVDAGGITDTMWVTLQVLGECNATSASVTPSSLSFQAYVGGQNPSAQTLRVKDDCGHAVSATVVSNPSWVTLRNTGTGVFSVSCDASGLSKGTHRGTITLTDDEYSQQHSVLVTLTVTETSSSDDSVTTVTSGFTNSYNIGPRQTKYFKFVAGISDCSRGIQVGNTPDSPYRVHVLVKRGSKPTVADFERTGDMPQSQYNCRLGEWTPAKPASAEDLYWGYNTISPTEFVEIAEPMEPQTFYIMLYNDGTQTINTELSVHYYD